jgi:hypothetical protein
MIIKHCIHVLKCHSVPHLCRIAIDQLNVYELRYVTTEDICNRKNKRGREILVVMTYFCTLLVMVITWIYLRDKISLNYTCILSMSIFLVLILDYIYMRCNYRRKLSRGYILLFYSTFATSCESIIFHKNNKF